MDAESILSKETMFLVREIAKNSEYFNKIIYNIHEDIRFKGMPFLSFYNTKHGLQITNYNLNLYKYLLLSETMAKILSDERFTIKYLEGRDEFQKRWSGFKVTNFKTWNTLLHLFRIRRDKEFLSEKENFTNEEILDSYKNSGFLDAYLEYEEENSLLVMSFINLQNSKNNNVSAFKIPISTYYDFNLPTNESGEITIDAKVEFIILNETMQLTQYKNTSTNIKLAKIISDIINNKFKNYRIKNPCTPDNIRNILTADSHFPDYTSRKSAYKKRNIKKAIDQLYQMGVKFEHCQFLPKIKIMKPTLFE
jgi:hypothetical protein